MSYLTKKLLFLVVFLCMCCNANASCFLIDFDHVCPYVGIEGQYRWLDPNGKDSFTIAGRGPGITMSQIASRSYRGVNAFVGGRYDWMGLEFGGHYAAAQKNFSSIQFTTRFSGAYIDFVGYLPTPACIELMGMLGIGYTGTRTSFTIPTGNGFSLSAHSGTVLPRLRVGANYMFNYWAGIRALVGYESTHLLRLNAGSRELHPYGDSLLGSLGLFVKF